MRTLAVALLTLTGLAARPCAADEPVLIGSVPHVRQKPDFCGEACAEMALRRLGHQVSQDAVFDVAGVDPALGRGCRTPELARGLRALGFEVGPVWHEVPPAKAQERLASLFDALVADLRRGVPSIVCTRYDAREGASEHFRLVLGWDPAKAEVIYHEPAEADAAYRRMSRATLLDLWPLKYRADAWTVVRLRLEPRQVRPPAPRAAPTPATYAQHVRRLRERLPGPGFSIVVEPPFVVVGDESPAQVGGRAQHTVRWAVERLKALYFEKDPGEVLDVWLFKDRASYERNALKLFGERPSTPYGYYSSRHRALVMNIATGGGTLVHEIVHPFVRANFPACPAWLNEGLASLYEQSSERAGRIVGLTNWRLAGLQRTIKQGALRSFEALLRSGDGFYGAGSGTNYAQARYLCYYLQEQGLLVRFFKRFQETAARDPSGLAALRSVLEEEDLAAFQRRWERWVLDLRFEG